MGGNTELEGPDFSLGIPLDAIPAGGTLRGRVGDAPVLLSRFADGLFAVGGACTHYGAALGGGLIAGGTARCPWHHACFDLRTGAALRAPALDPLDLWQVEVEDGTAFVRRKLERSSEPARSTGVKQIVIVGGGAAGLACANELRRLGYAGAITMLSADADAPVDRPNLSKDFLAGTAPEDWMPLRPEGWYAENAIDLRLGCEVGRIDVHAGHVATADGERFPYDRLLVATGSEPNRLNAPGFDHDHVFTLRSFADAREIVGHVREGAQVVIIGASFIGLEAAAALRKRGAEVHIVSPERVPFERVFGGEVGGFFQALHERNGVRFHLGCSAGGFDGRSVSLANGKQLAADLVLVGIGVRPRTALLESAGLAEAGGVKVDANLETAADGIYAVGDIAAYADPQTGEPTRIEHWVTAERQGQTAAANMLGLDRRYDAVPFFWTEQFGTTLRYVGHAARWDEVIVDGDVARGEFVARYYEAGVHRASAGVGRDLAILEDERLFEQRMTDTQSGNSNVREPRVTAGIQ